MVKIYICLSFFYFRYNSVEYRALSISCGVFSANHPENTFTGHMGRLMWMHSLIIALSFIILYWVQYRVEFDRAISRVYSISCNLTLPKANLRSDFQVSTLDILPEARPTDRLLRAHWTPKRPKEKRPTDHQFSVHIERVCIYVF